jgi:hypothetical protein
LRGPLASPAFLFFPVLAQLAPLLNPFRAGRQQIPQPTSFPTSGPAGPNYQTWLH